MIGFSCPCGLRYMASDGLAGRDFVCPACRAISIIPDPAQLRVRTLIRDDGAGARPPGGAHAMTDAAASAQHFSADTLRMMQTFKAI